MDYLFSKCAAIFGNGMALDDKASGLRKDEQSDIVGVWVTDRRGSPKNGHTSHLLLSFPLLVRPEKAKLITEAWAFEMFQSGEHQDDVWSYVEALHTDRAHPHIHIVVNNCGILNQSWFAIANSRLIGMEAGKVTFRIRHYGFLANGQRAAHLAACRALLATEVPEAAIRAAPAAKTARAVSHPCPCCGRPMVTLALWYHGQAPPGAPFWNDSS